ncbi:MAG: hypothetical protein FOGNACKC_05651 [Anaerolineae bacterium]|nr:hypothetical protein [Anaerolineae bacterium]
MPTLEDAIQHIRMGNRAEGRALLEDLLDADENNEDIWLWLSTVVDSDDDREICLENVLALDPNNVVALRGIEALRSGIFDTDDLLRELMEDTSPESTEPAGTFLDDFMIGEDEGLVDDDDLLLPSEVRKRAKKKRGGKVNVRLIILAVLGLILVVILGGLAVASIFFFENSGGGPEATAVVTEEAPGQNPQVEPSAAPTDTPTPGPTDTPTVTAVPKLQLPTPKPTDLPTPTATRVVSPTPIR